MTTPSITAAQIVTVLGSGIALAAAFGFALSDIQTAAVLGFVGIIGGLFLHSDAKIRNGRAEVAKAQVEAEALSTHLGPSPVGDAVHDAAA